MPWPIVGSISTIVTCAPAASSHSAVSQPVALPPTTTTRSPGSTLTRPCRISWASSDARPADARDRRDQRLGAGGDDHDVGRLARRPSPASPRPRCGPRTPSSASRARLVVAEVAAPRACSARAQATSSLPPSSLVALPDRDVVAAQAGDPRRLHARRARCRRPSRAADRAAGSTRPRRARGPTSGLTAQRAASAARDEVDAGVAGDAGPDRRRARPPRPCAASPGRRSARGRCAIRSASPSASTSRRASGSSSRPTAITGTVTAP